MKYLIDTNIVIDHFKGKKPVVDFLQEIKQSEFALSVVSIAEILEGLIGQPQEDNRREEFSEFLLAVQVLDVDIKIVEGFAKLRSSLRKKGKLIDNFDLLIAASAIENQLILVTNDQDFERVPDLQIKKIPTP